MDGKRAAQIGSIIAVLIGVVNLLTIREYWVLGLCMVILIPLTIYSVSKKNSAKKIKSSKLE